MKNPLRSLLKNRAHTPDSNQKGNAAELAAHHFIEQQGLHLITKNYRCRCGEIDLIATDHDALIFIEVRLRNRGQWGDGAASVDLRKQSKLIRTSQHFLLNHRKYQNRNCRFDVISIKQSGGNGLQYRFDWIQNAFDASSSPYS